VSRFVVFDDLGYFLPEDETFLNDLSLQTVDPEQFRDDPARCARSPGPIGPQHRALFEAIIQRLFERDLETAFLDIGGYVGMFGLPIAQVLKDRFGSRGRVHIFEPTPLVECIEASIEINDLLGVAVAHHAAVSDREGALAYFARPGERISGRLFDFPGADRLYDIPTTSVDRFLASQSRVDLVVAKIDTEGHEPAVLEGSLGTFESTLAILVLELWPWRRDAHVAGDRYVDFLLDRFHLFDIEGSTHPRGFMHVDRNSIDPFLADVEARPTGNTDLLCIDRRWGTVEEARAFFRGLYGTS
jgi:FkbM family methyltransferase